MEAYYCKCCKYYTPKLSRLKDHLTSKKHTDNGGAVEVDNYNIFKKTLFICSTCDNIYMSKQNLQNHEAMCHTENYIEPEPVREIVIKKDKVVNPIKLVKKQKIPHVLRMKVWNKWIGIKVGETKCLCCKLNDISQLNFNCGHIVAESKGGELKEDNLKPICQSCNSSMGTQNMNEFILKYGF